MGWEKAGRVVKSLSLWGTWDEAMARIDGLG
jgi:hypothetical protein